MASHGFDTWVLEARGAGLSKICNKLSSSQSSETDSGLIQSLPEDSVLSTPNAEQTDGSPGTEKGKSLPKAEQTDGSPGTDSKVLNDIIEKSKSFVDGQSQLPSSPLRNRVTNLIEYMQLSERFAKLQERLLQLLGERKDSGVAKQVIDLSNRLLKLLDDGQRALTPPLSDLQDRLINTQQITDLQDRLISTIDDFQKLLDLIVTQNWDFDDFLEEDLPAVVFLFCFHPILVL